MTQERSEIKERLMEFLRIRRIKQKEFTAAIGVSQTYVGAMRKGISSEKILRIREQYPELNTDWLLYGEGEMLREGYGEDLLKGVCILDKKEKTPDDDNMIPLLPVEACAGRLSDFSEGVRLSDCRRVPSPIRGAELAIEVSGDSMEPKIPDGATIVMKRINEQAFIPWGNIMVIDTENGVLVKMVFPGDGQDTIEARSINPKYPPISIPRSSIYGLYRVLGSVQLFPTY